MISSINIYIYIMFAMLRRRKKCCNAIAFGARQGGGGVMIAFFP